MAVQAAWRPHARGWTPAQGKDYSAVALRAGALLATVLPLTRGQRRRAGRAGTELAGGLCPPPLWVSELLPGTGLHGAPSCRDPRWGRTLTKAESRRFTLE